MLHLMDLPPEVRVKIFSFCDLSTLLLKVQILSKDIHKELNRKSTWKSFLSLTIEEEKLRAKFTAYNLSEIATQIRRCSHLRFLKITSPSCFNIQPSFFECLSELRELEVLTLRGFFIDTKCEEALLNFFNISPPRLKGLDLYLSTIESLEALQAIPNVKSLKHFVAPESKLEAYQVYENIFSNCKQFEYFDVSYQNFLGLDPDIPFRLNLRADTLKTLIIMENPHTAKFFDSLDLCTKVSTLKVDCSKLGPSIFEKIKDLPLEQVFLTNALYSSYDVERFIGFRKFFNVANITNLTHVGFHNCCIIDDDCLQILGSRSPNLISLNLKGLDDVTDIGLNSIAFQCPKLASLTLLLMEKVKCTFLAGIKVTLPLFTILVIAQAEQVAYCNVKSFLEEYPEFKHKPYESTYESGFGTDLVSPNSRPMLFTDRFYRPDLRMPFPGKYVI